MRGLRGREGKGVKKGTMEHLTNNAAEAMAKV